MAAIRRTAEILNDTLAVTRASYVHPAILASFDQDEAPERPRKRSLAEPITRREELAVLAVLRRAKRSAGTARRSQPSGRRPTGRARSRAA